MPIYEYSCARCGRAFEEIVLRRSDEAEVRCPRCASPRVERLVSRPAAPRTGGGRPPAACGPVG